MDKLERFAEAVATALEICVQKGTLTKEQSDKITDNLDKPAYIKPFLDLLGIDMGDLGTSDTGEQEPERGDDPRQARSKQESCGWCDDNEEPFFRVHNKIDDTAPDRLVLAISANDALLKVSLNEGDPVYVGLCINFCPACGRRLEARE